MNKGENMTRTAQANDIIDFSNFKKKDDAFIDKDNNKKTFKEKYDYRFRGFLANLPLGITRSNFTKWWKDLCNEVEKNDNRQKL